MISAIRRAFGAATLTAAAVSMVAPLAVSAQESGNRVATMTDWSVFVEGKECWGVSKPKETVNSKDGKAVSVRRGDILLFVTYRSGKSGEVSFTGGYPFAPGSTVNVNVDGKTFELFTDGEWAWAGSPADDTTILNALKAGGSAILTARSGKGTQTKDTFSLRGFTAAMNDAGTRCK